LTHLNGKLQYGMVHEYDKIFMENCQLGTEPGEEKKEKKVYLTNVHTSNKRGGLSPASFLLDHLSPSRSGHVTDFTR